jgi:hypothetical protein
MGAYILQIRGGFIIINAFLKYIYSLDRPLFAMNSFNLILRVVGEIAVVDLLHVITNTNVLSHKT